MWVQGYVMLFFLLTAGIGFEPVDGMTFGAEYDPVRLGVIVPGRVGGWIEGEGAVGFNRGRHGLRTVSNAESRVLC